jgi:hypothetical protein
MNKLFLIILTSVCLISCNERGDDKTLCGSFITRTNKTIDTSCKKKWYNVSCIPLCDDSKGIFLDLKELTKHGRYKPYNTTQTINKDSAIVSFDFIDDCCMEFSGDITVTNDTLMLYFFQTNIICCDCYCDYRISYHINKTGQQWNNI